MSSTAGTVVQAPSVALCQACNKRPCYVDRGYTHPYCGRTCATAAAAAVSSSALQPPAVAAAPSTAPPAAAHTQPVTTTSAAEKAGKTATPAADPLCLECKAKSTFKDKSGTSSQYCSRTCLGKAVEAAPCLSCKKKPKFFDTSIGKHLDFCGKQCRSKVFSQAPTLIELDGKSPAFQSVSDQFSTTWRHSTRKPTLVRLFKVYSSSDAQRRYNTYRDAVEATGQHELKNRAKGNECRRFHGTVRLCNIGNPGTGPASFCNNTGCSLCSILRTSFDLQRFGKRTGWGCFGHGIYTSATSSKSDSYLQGTQGGHKAFIMAKVILGKTCTLKHANSSLTAPPAGYDSVVGEPDPAGQLNYDEAIVYTEDAIRPQYLLIVA